MGSSASLLRGGTESLKTNKWVVTPVPISIINTALPSIDSESEHWRGPETEAVMIRDSHYYFEYPSGDDHVDDDYDGYDLQFDDFYG